MNDNNIKNDDINNMQFKKKGKIILNKKKIKIKKGKINQINNNDNIINNIIINNNLNNDIIIINKNKNEKNNLSEKNTKMDEVKNLTTIIDYNDDEINDLSYDLALQNDKRTYWQLYNSFIKTKHEFIYAFFYNKDYNSKIIKIDL